MNARIILAAGLAAVLASCSPFGNSGRSAGKASMQFGASLPAGAHAPGGTGVQAAALSAGTGAPSAGHVDAPGAAPHSHDAAEVYGQPGDAAQPARTVEIIMSETDDGQMIFSPHEVRATAGEQVRFKLRNSGQLEHEFVLATPEANRKHGSEMQKNPDMEHDDPNAVRLASGESGEILWKFTNSGVFEFACLIPGHRESGMVGLAAVM